MSGAEPTQILRSQPPRAAVRPLNVALEAPCPTCVHREVCLLRERLVEAIGGGDIKGGESMSLSVGLGELPRPLHATFVVTVECDKYLGEKRRGRPRIPRSPEAIAKQRATPAKRAATEATA